MPTKEMLKSDASFRVTKVTGKPESKANTMKKMSDELKNTASGEIVRGSSIDPEEITEEVFEELSDADEAVKQLLCEAIMKYVQPPKLYKGAERGENLDSMALKLSNRTLTELYVICPDPYLVETEWTSFKIAEMNRRYKKISP